MTDEELHAVVRDAIARAGLTGQNTDRARTPAPAVPLAVVRHASHVRFVLPAGADHDGSCLIEPAVTCNHCGYCVSSGH